jgi:hypothetical protein
MGWASCSGQGGHCGRGSPRDLFQEHGSGAGPALPPVSPHPQRPDVGSHSAAGDAAMTASCQATRLPVPASRPRAPGRGGWERRGYMAFGPLLDSVPTARHWTGALLREWGMLPGAADALIVVTELISNAVHASLALPSAADVRLWLCSGQHRILLQAGDHSAIPPTRVNPAPGSEHGRGLLAVQALSATWGWFPATTHGLAKIVWSELPLPPSPRS